MNLLKNRYVFVGLSVLTILDIINLTKIIWEERGLHNIASLPWEVFYYGQLTGSHESYWHFLIFVGLVPVVFIWMLIYQKNSQIDNFVLTRLSRSSYLVKQGKQLFLLAFFYKIFLIILELAIVGFHYGHLDFGLHFNPDRDIIMYFSHNAGTQILAYTLYSAIGWGVWMLFVYSIGLFINRTILVIPMSYLVFFIAVVAPILLSRLPIVFIQRLAFILSLNNVVAPGLLAPTSSWEHLGLYAALSLAFYGGLTLLLFKLYITRAEQGLGE